MTCPQRDVLLNAYIKATDRQAEDIGALVKSKNKPNIFGAAMKRVEESRLEAERARIALRKHTDEHGC
jgi:hypothetical protein